jgi:exopolysaccharide production protein ExoY
MDGVAVHMVLATNGAPPVRARVGRVGRHAAVSLHAVDERPLGEVVRRLVDVVGAASLLVLLTPVLALVAALVWWRMGWPVVYSQQRVGRGGRRFPVYKFRSMVANADQVLRASPALYRRYVAFNHKLPEEEDPRITPLGRLLRRTSLDELPQLWNVIRGDMSLVGPRPVVPDEVAEYGDWAGLLLRAKPGVTGAWQVGGRSAIGYPERARIDLHYVAGRSLSEDVRILLRTLPAVLRRRGAM